MSSHMDIPCGCSGRLVTGAVVPESPHVHLLVMMTLGLYSCGGRLNRPQAKMVMQLRKDWASNLEDNMTQNVCVLFEFFCNWL